MAKRRPPPSPAPFSPDEKQSALVRLETRINELSNLDPSQILSSDDEPVQSLSQRIASTLASIYGEDSAEYDRLRIASDLDATVYSIGFGGQVTPPHEIQQGVKRGKDRALAVLRGEAHSLREDLQFAAPTPTGPKPAINAATPSDEIFIVHGQDSPAKIEVARLIERAGLKAIILHEQPNQGRTIIEKFEDHGGSSGFAVIVITADDVGGLKRGPQHPRARQNVIGEMFWFAGRLGRDRVCALKKGEIELPSDFAGVGYTDMDGRGAWKQELLRELQAAGYDEYRLGQGTRVANEGLNASFE